MVSVSEIRELDKRTNGSFCDRTFSELEKLDATGASDRYEFLAGRFAVKEAVYKAICGRFSKVNFDFRIVETKRLKNGAPSIVMNPKVKEVLYELGLETILISISYQGDMVIAIAMVL